MVFIFKIKPSYLETEQNILPKAKLCQRKIELYIKTAYSKRKHDAYLMIKPFMGIYVNVQNTETSEIRILVYEPDTNTMLI